jgi:LysM repeat protein
MSTPNPLVPQGTFQSQATNVRIAVATIVAIHIVFFGGLLLQGCKREPKVTDAGAGDTNAAVTNLSLPPIDTSSLYYPSATSLPAADPITNIAATTPTGRVADTITPDPWQATNLPGAAIPAASTAAAEGAMKEYTVAARDTLSKIAVNNGVTLSALRKANPNVDPAKIRPGMKIKVPAAANGTPAATTTGAPTPTTSSAVGSAPSATVYTVKAGDNLTKIARDHGVTVGQLRAANNLKTSKVNAGQKLKIPARTQALNQGTNAARPAGVPPL